MNILKNNKTEAFSAAYQSTEQYYKTSPCVLSSNQKTAEDPDPLSTTSFQWR